MYKINIKKTKLIGKRNIRRHEDLFTLIEIKEMQNKTIITGHFILTVKKNPVSIMKQLQLHMLLRVEQTNYV